ncbi:cytochrome c551 [Geomicrobium sp. JCM 19037]|uniref:c-type cytochrome n=1 Tax=Geomicrobium sp. JCM 19037 TaxID=1460634 RepID=UPI00045F37B5|nr:c-type cytochrome [Geomicrobium sp. JCM 19037]GAK02609.1 cytochrome c551 [Geomicrobium sp. JCM 19037]
MKKFLMTCSVAMLILGGCGGGDDAPADDNGNGEQADGVSAEEGMALYEENCMSCHGGDLEGASAPALEGYSEEEVYDAIEQGPGSMPAGLVSGEDAEAVSKYVAQEG